MIVNYNIYNKQFFSWQVQLIANDTQHQLMRGFINSLGNKRLQAVQGWCQKEAGSFIL